MVFISTYTSLVCDGEASTLATVAKKKSSRQARAFNPKGLPFVTQPEPVESESASALWTRLQGNWQVLSASCVSVGSRVTYKTAWTHWECLCARLQADVSLKAPFALWDPHSSCHPYEVTMVVSFIAYLQSKRPVILPGTVDNYVSGLRHCLMQLNVSELVFKAPVVVQCRAALNIQHRIENPENEAKTLPFLAEWFPTLRRLLNMCDIKCFMLVVAFQLAFVCLLRSSEVVVTADDHFLRACDVSFELRATNADNIWVAPVEAAQYDEDLLEGITIKIRSAKNDQGGRGYKYYFARNRELSSTAAFDLVVDMFRLARLTQPVGLQAFFSYQGWALPYYRFNEVIKLVARESAADPSRYSCHSLRIGGATILAAANFPDYIIQNMGRWKSLAFLHYLHWAPSMMRSAMSALTDMSIFTFSDLGKMNAGVALHEGQRR